MKIFRYGITAIVIFSLICFLGFTDLSAVSVQLESIGNQFYLILLISAFSFFLGSLAWKYCFQMPSKIPFFKLFLTRTIGETIAFINPTSIVAGEASKVQLLSNLKIPLRDKTDSIFIARIILISSQLVLAVICMLWFGAMHGLLLSMLAGFLVIVAIGFIIYFNVNKFLQYRNRGSTSQFQKSLFYYKIHSLRFFHRFILFVKHRKKQFGIAFTISSLHWLVGAFELYYILYLLNIDASLIKTLSMDTGVIILKSVGGFVPGQIGIEELGNKWMLALIGIKTAGIWISVSIIRRARQLIWIILSMLVYSLILIKTKKIQNGYTIYNT